MCDLDARAFGHRPLAQHERVLARQPVAGIGLEVHGGIHQHLASRVVVGHLIDVLAEHIEKRRDDVEGLARVAILARPVQASAADLVVTERLRAVLQQTVGAHVIIRADHQPAQRVHQRVVAIPAIAGGEQTLDE